MNRSLSVVGRVFLALVFIISGFGKIAGYSGAQHYMQSAGIPGMLLPLVILLELGGGICIALGLFTRYISICIALFCLATAAIFHAHFQDQMQAVSFWKNIAIAGGFLVLAANGPGAFSLDHCLRHRQNTMK